MLGPHLDDVRLRVREHEADFVEDARLDLGAPVAASDPPGREMRSGSSIGTGAR